MTRKRKRHPAAAATASPTGDNAGATRTLRTVVVVGAGIATIAGLLWFWTRAAHVPSASRELASREAVQPATALTAHEPQYVDEYVDEGQCAACHSTQAASWHGSHHDLAMQEATAATVLGDFNDAVFVKDGVRTRFYRRGDRFWINTDGPDGESADYEVKYTFGVEPLQQYLLPLDRGRLQAFTIAWDTHNKRWFHLYPGERIDHRDELHWTRLSQNWNSMCAECHSTDLKKNYDAATQTYHTSWKQIDVGCQACHGPASEHLARVRAAATGKLATGDWAKGVADSARSISGQQPAADKRLPGSSRSQSMGFVVDLSAPGSTPQIEMCARCHSRRASLWGDYRHGRPLLDTHLPSLLEPGLYFADGQIQAEVYEYGSFLQAKMHTKGLRCSDCHDPHSLQTRAPGNALCVSCHNSAAPAARAGIDTAGLRHKDYDSPAHHFHQPGQPGSQCVDCHAPPRTYMVVDPRRDHSFRIPRPDLSAKLGTPNACNQCHANRSSQWAAERVAHWYGSGRRQETTYGELLWAARAGQPGAAAALTQLARDVTQPDIVRATALEQLRAYPGAPAFETIHSQLGSTDALIRLAALNGLEMLPPERAAPLLTPFLDDAVRAVRLDAVGLTARVPLQALGPAQRERLLAGIREFEATQAENAEQPASWMNLGNLRASLGDMPAAEAAYRSAITLDESFVPAYVNLADLKSQVGDNAVAIAVLQSALDTVPGNAALQHALGLALTRDKRYDEGIKALSLAAKSAPDNTRYAYVYGVALHDTGNARQAVAVLKQALRRSPGDQDILAALAAYADEANDAAAARQYRQRLQVVAQ